VHQLNSAPPSDAEHFFEDCAVYDWQTKLLKLGDNFRKSKKPLRLGRHFRAYHHSTTLLHSCA